MTSTPDPLINHLGCPPARFIELVSKELPAIDLSKVKLFPDTDQIMHKLAKFRSKGDNKF